MAYTNLFDGWLERGNIGISSSSSPGQNAVDSTRIRSRNYIKVSASTSYSVYRKYANGGFGVRYYDSSKTFLSNASPFASTTKGGLFVTPANCAYIRFIDETNQLDNRYWMAKSTVLLDDSKFAQVIAIGQCTLYDVTDVYTSATEPPMAERYDGFLWLDTASDTIKKWNAASKQWVILNDFTDAIQNAARDLQEQINDIVSDSVLTPSEKLILANEMTRIKQETSNLIASAEDLSMSYANLKSAYDALYKYINPFITEAMMQVNSDIDAEKYKTLFKNYYTAKEALEQAIKSELNVEIGGTQLLQHSHFPVGTKKWNLCGGKASVSTSVKFRGRNSVKIVGAGTAIAERLNPLEAYYAPYTAGEMLTLRFWIMCPDVSKVTSDVQTYIAYRKDGYIANGSNSKLITKDDFVNAGNSTWFSVTITGKSDVIENIWCTALIQFNNTAATFYVSSPKLEYGTRPTDYCQSEEDAQEEVDALKRYTRNILLTSGNYNLGKKIQWIEDGKEQWYIEPKDGYVQLTKSGTGTQSWACLPLSQSIAVGETYTLMFKFRRSQKQNLNFCLVNYAGRKSYKIGSVVETIAVNEWQTHTVTFTATSAMSNADYLMLTSTDFTVDKENIDFEWLILSKGERVDEWSPAYEDVDDMYDILIDAISDVDKTIRIDITDYIDKENGKLGREISENYTLKSDTETIQKALASLIEQTPEDIQMAFSKSETYTSEVEGAFQTFVKELETYIRFSIEGIELGEVDSPFMTKLDNTKLAFIQNGTEIAYISNHKLYITEAEISHRLTFGTAEKGYFDWIVEDNGSLSLARRNV